MAKDQTKSKITVKFKTTDAPKPILRRDKFVALRAPIPLTWKAGTSFKFHSGVSCDYPVVVVGSRLTVVGPLIHTFETEIACELRNDTPDDQIFDIGETVIVVVPIGTTDIEIG